MLALEEAGPTKSKTMIPKCCLHSSPQSDVPVEMYSYSTIFPRWSFVFSSLIVLFMYTLEGQ